MSDSAVFFACLTARTCGLSMGGLSVRETKSVWWEAAMLLSAAALGIAGSVLVSSFMPAVVAGLGHLLGKTMADRFVSDTRDDPRR